MAGKRKNPIAAQDETQETGKASQGRSLRSRTIAARSEKTEETKEVKVARKPKEAKEIKQTKKTKEPKEIKEPSANTNKPIYFWREYGDPNCYLSQWYASPFHTGDPDGIIYQTAEQYMMHQKAILFSDSAIASKILATTSPKAQKALGRKVANFDDETWILHRSRIVGDASYFKFRYGGDEGELKDDGGEEVKKTLRQRLLETGDKEIVEASPMDKIWGIGLTAAKADAIGEWNRERWGLNLLGKALMEARERLRREEKEGEAVTEK